MSSELDPIEALLGEKWFWPIIVRLNNFESRLVEVIPLLEPILRDDSPDWPFRCVQDVALVDSESNGFCDPRKLDARAVGRMVGAKIALCESMAASHSSWKTLTPEEILEIETAWDYPGMVTECTELAWKFAEDLAPGIRDLKRAASDIAADQGGIEEVDYLQGYIQGTAFMTRIRARFKPTRNKRQEDFHNRQTVFFFAALFGSAIEEVKGEASWPELHQTFLEAFDYKVDIDEDTFKKILSRKGLKGVGKPGRPVKDNRDTAA